jgi:hypothetical protein
LGWASPGGVTACAGAIPVVAVGGVSEACVWACDFDCGELPPPEPPPPLSPAPEFPEDELLPNKLLNNPPTVGTAGAAAAALTTEYGELGARTRRRRRARRCATRCGDIRSDDLIARCWLVAVAHHQYRGDQPCGDADERQNDGRMDDVDLRSGALQKVLDSRHEQLPSRAPGGLSTRRMTLAHEARVIAAAAKM